MRRLVAILATVLVAASACSSQGPTPPPSTRPTVPTTRVEAQTTSTTADPAAALAAYVSGLSHVVSSSGVAADGGTVIALTARQLSQADREVDVLSWSGTAWATLAALTLPGPLYSLADLPIQVADVTGDGRPDFLVRVDAADNQPGAVVSDDGGTWRFVPLAPVDQTAPGDVYAGRDPSFESGHLVTIYNDCTPDCAQGATTTVTWGYDRATGRFVRAGT